jgi:hypothetical protein
VRLPTPSRPNLTRDSAGAQSILFAQSYPCPSPFPSPIHLPLFLSLFPSFSAESLRWTSIARPSASVRSVAASEPGYSCLAGAVPVRGEGGIPATRDPQGRRTRADSEKKLEAGPGPAQTKFKLNAAVTESLAHRDVSRSRALGAWGGPGRAWARPLAAIRSLCGPFGVGSEPLGRTAGLRP